MNSSSSLLSSFNFRPFPKMVTPAHPLSLSLTTYYSFQILLSYPVVLFIFASSSKVPTHFLTTTHSLHFRRSTSPVFTLYDNRIIIIVVSSLIPTLLINDHLVTNASSLRTLRSAPLIQFLLFVFHLCSASICSLALHHSHTFHESCDVSFFLSLFLPSFISCSSLSASWCVIDVQLICNYYKYQCSRIMLV